MSVRKFAGLPSDTTETGEDLSAGAVENFNLLVVLIDHVHVLLSGIARKTDPHCRSESAGLVLRTRRELGHQLELDGDVLLEVSHFIEHLNAVAAPVADVHQAIVVECHAMEHGHKGVASLGLRA